MTPLLRLACVLCLAGCCFQTRPLPVIPLAAGALAFGLLSEFTRSDVCWCGDILAVHEHDRPGSDCRRLGCPCREFRRVWIWRTS